MDGARSQAGKQTLVEAADGAGGHRLWRLAGEIIEYASNCAGPIHHKAGEIRPETQGTSHWWKNLSDTPVVPAIGDLRKEPNDHHM